MNKLTTLLSVSTLLLFASCKEPNSNGDAPSLPPVGTLSLNLDTMNAAPEKAKNANVEQGAVLNENSNFANAWARVKTVQFFSALVIVTPAITMAAALNSESSNEGEYWLWDIKVGNTEADLQISGNAIKGWNSKLLLNSNKLKDYLWLEGSFRTGAGEWILHDPKVTTGDDSALSIQWTYMSEQDRALRYEILSSTANKAGDTFTGDTFTFTQSGNTAVLEYEDKNKPSDVAEIQWDVKTGVGSITVPSYNDGKKACWSEKYTNTVCL